MPPHPEIGLRHFDTVRAPSSQGMGQGMLAMMASSVLAPSGLASYIYPLLEIWQGLPVSLAPQVGVPGVVFRSYQGGIAMQYLVCTLVPHQWPVLQWAPASRLALVLSLWQRLPSHPVSLGLDS